MDIKHISESLTVRESHLPDSSFARVTMTAASFEEVTLARTRFSKADLSDLHITRSNLSGLAIAECKTDEMTIDGVKVADLFAAYRQSRAG